MSLLEELNSRLKNVITGTCNTKGCNDCDLKWDGGCSATELQNEIMDIEMNESSHDVNAGSANE